MSGGRSPQTERASETAFDPARRRRVHWLCARADGERVLDASGDGAAALLLAGEGREATALEREPGALEEARRRLSSTAGVGDARVDVVARGTEAGGPEADAFDTVLIGDRLEDTASVARSLGEARRALRPGGRLAIAMPYGASPWLDRDEPAGLRPLLAALEEHGLAVEEVELSEGQLGIVARAGEADGPAEPGELGPWLDALEAANRRLAKQEREIDRRRDELEHRDRELAERTGALERAERRRSRLEERVKKLEERHQAAQARAQDLRERLSGRDAELGEAKEAAARDRGQLETLRASRSFRLVRLAWRVRAAMRRRGGSTPTAGDEPSSR